MKTIFLLAVAVYVGITSYQIDKLEKDIEFLKQMSVVTGATLHKKFGIKAKDSIKIFKEYAENNIDFTE